MQLKCTWYTADMKLGCPMRSLNSLQASMCCHTKRAVNLLFSVQSSLTGAQALMITCVQAEPGKQARQEALATLQFASMTRKVQTCPRMNVVLDKEAKVR
jgi:hypothetical protein